MYDVRFIDSDEWEDAMQLAYETFLKYDAAYFSEEGIKHFREFVSDSTLKRMNEAGSFQVIGCYAANLLVGVAAMRNLNHISLLFIKGEYHRKGIGRRLVNELADYAKIKLHQEFLTVHAAPYAYDFYRRLGFKDTDVEQTQDGIKYIPMRYDL